MFYVYATGLTYIVLCGAFWWRESTQARKLTDLTVDIAQLRQELARCQTDRRTLEIVLGDAVKVIKKFEKGEAEDVLYPKWGKH